MTVKYCNGLWVATLDSGEEVAQKTYQKLKTLHDAIVEGRVEYLVGRRAK